MVGWDGEEEEEKEEEVAVGFDTGWIVFFVNIFRIISP